MCLFRENPERVKDFDREVDWSRIHVKDLFEKENAP
jgi:hypothetical protein